MSGIVLRLRDTTLTIGHGAPLVMGVVNASPESFSDGAEAATLDRQLARAQAFADAGAKLLDVGGESGVTNRPPISAEVEIERILPLVTRLVAAGHLVSVDTWKASVASAALDAGAHLINDVSGLADPEIADHCARAGAGLVIMHTRAAPKVKAFPAYDDVVEDVVAFLEEKMALARACGVRAEQVVVDPGPDFAKTPSQTVTVLHRLPEFARFGRPIPPRRFPEGLRRGVDGPESGGPPGGDAGRHRRRRRRRCLDPPSARCRRGDRLPHRPPGVAARGGHSRRPPVGRRSSP